MYSSRIIERNLDLYEAQNGWRPVRHTLDQVKEFREGIDKLVRIGSNTKGSWIDGLNYAITDKRKAEIKRWIENEQILAD